MPCKLLMLPPQSSRVTDWPQRLRADVPEMQVIVAHDEREAIAAIADTEAAYGTLTPEILRHAQKLRWLQSPKASPPKGFYFAELIAHPVTVTNFRGIFDDRIGAHIMAFVLAFARGFHYYFPHQVRGEWAPRPEDTGVVHLPEATALVVGAGGIGAEAARLLSAFGVTVLATDARVRTAPEGVAELHDPAALDALLPRADFVILTVPLTPETESFFGRARFQRMKPGAFFINIGRGKTTVLDDLVAALRAGEIAGAGLDVFEQEPLPAGHPLWTMPGVMITPHVALYGPHLNERRYDITRDNCRRFLAGAPLRNVVDKRNWF
jgi:phosphoglycerate dehydrogenase-like enzyme